MALTYEERNKLLTRHDAQKLAEKLVMPLVKFNPVGVCYQHYKKGEPDDADTTNFILLEVKKDNSNEVNLRIGACRKGTDRMYSNYLFEAGKTQEEVKTWLENMDVCVPIILESAKALSDRVDEYWD